MRADDSGRWRSTDVVRLLAISESGRRYYLNMLESLPVAVALLSVDRAIVAANRVFRGTFQLKREDLGRKTLDQVLPSDPLIAAVKEIGNGGAPAQSNVYLEAEGRRFRVSLTAQHNPEGDEDPEIALVVEDLVRATILLVIGDVKTLDDCSQMLRSAHYDVIEASSAKHAIRLAAAHGGPIHLLSTHTRLPDLPGTDLAGLLKTRLPGMRVLYMCERGRDAPAGDTTLEEPFTPGAFLDKVRAVLYPR